MSNQQIDALAGKIAEIISAGPASDDLASIRSSLDAISSRLDRLETTLDRLPDTTHHAVTTFVHPSQQRFELAEAVVENAFATNGHEKACTFEPSKPCDHCSMCSSRGF
jgi:hypothetical protein